ncbi:MAG: RdgB/HAM1 family non-canonical purine NTP pyrophosphatase [Acidobacteria bacterium]|nr:RdgB/HAM1 family non-canonical purine NTP pyrophosphatase [Acidobacteriota bacterium]
MDGSERLLVATTNTGKFDEIAALLAGVRLAIVSLASAPAVPEPDETGATFEENARQKATYYARATGWLTVAEDSGLEIDALDGEPGVRSARFPGGTYPEKFENIFRRLDERGHRDSPARFVCALALARGNQVLFEVRGVVEGLITREPRGTGGFGYDPIFFYPPLGRTLAEVEAGDKHAVSHRGHAFRALRAFLLDSDRRG